MSASIDMTLDGLSVALSKQHEQLWKDLMELSEQKVNKAQKSQIYKIGSSTLVTVSLESTRKEIPKDGAWCGGKLSKDIANVTIKPEDEKVAKVVTDHFKSQVQPIAFHPIKVKIFNALTINGQEVNLS